MGQTQSPTIPPYSEIGDDRFELGNGISCEWRREGRILVLFGTNATPSAADTWAKATIEAFNYYFQEQPVLAMHVMNNLPLTPYVRKKSQEISAGTAARSGRIAIVLRPSMFTAIIQKFIDFELRNVNSKLARRIFTAENTAEKWLAELINPTE